MSQVEGIEMAALRKLLTGLSDLDDDEIADTNPVERARIVIDRVEKLEQRTAALEDEVTRLEARLSDPEDGKDGKLGAIVETAQNLRSDESVVKLKAKDIVAATGCSRRYAYDLMDPDNSNSLVNERDWLLSPEEMEQYGTLELDNAGRRLGVDFEGVHSSGAPVNKFTNGNSEKEGSE